jgi:hypothetical protein
MITQEELDRDVTAIAAKIAQAEANKTKFLIAIDGEHGTQVELGNLIHEEERRARAGKRPSYDIDALRANIAKCDENVRLFNETIAKENATIARFREISRIIQDDFAKTPTVIVLDMREVKHDPWRNYG